MITSDNFNKYPDADELLNAIIDAKIDMRLMAQCDAQVNRQEDLVALMARAGCHHMFVGMESFNKETLKAVHKNQNRPELYQRIADLCWENGIDAHFSNIIGFPSDTRETISEHLDTLIGIGPTWASFYILCPIPGTEQYEDFQKQGIITERNLDRFDTTALTWDHPNLMAPQMRQELFGCYKRFYSARHVRRVARGIRGPRFSGSIGLVAGAAFQRFCATQRTHPMSGGIRRVRSDKCADYLQLRRSTYGFEMAPLPSNLALPQVDQEFSRRTNVAYLDSR